MVLGRDGSAVLTRRPVENVEPNVFQQKEQGRWTGRLSSIICRQPGIRSKIQPSFGAKATFRRFENKLQISLRYSGHCNALFGIPMRFHRMTSNLYICFSWSIRTLSTVNALSQDGDQPVDPRTLLRQPNSFLPILAEAIDSELVFYSHDMEGKFVYLSKSAESVLNHSPRLWIGRSFAEALTDCSCNDHIKDGGWKENAESTIRGRFCEIYDRDGNRIRLEYWRTQVVHDGQPVGLAGIVRRLPNSREMIEDEEYLAKVSLLSKVERQVLDLVVDGDMNKTIAANLDVAVRTVESRRSRAMIKLEVKSLTELVQFWMRLRQAESRRKD